MKTQTYTFTAAELNVTSIEIMEMMGYTDDIPTEIEDMVKVEMKSLTNLDDIQGGYRIVPAEMLSESKVIQIENKKFNIGKTVFPLLKKASSIAIFICTAGEVISSKSKELMSKGDLLEGYIVDVIGSVMVEKAMDLIQAKLTDNQQAVGLNVTNRYSPGYCEWNVGEQQHLFALMPDKYCGVTLNNSSLMSPVKSVSGFMGIGANIKYKKYNCEMCTQQNCIYGNQNRKRRAEKEANKSK